MAINTDRPNDGRKQIVYSEKRKLFKEKYLSPKGELLLKLKQVSKEEAWKRYGKNRYTINPNAVPVREIIHFNHE